MRAFLLTSLSLLPFVFVGMAVLVKLTHSAAVRLRGPGAGGVWLVTLAPGLACVLACAVSGWWPVAVDCAFSAVALGVLGARSVPPPRFEV